MDNITFVKKITKIILFMFVVGMALAFCGSVVYAAPSVSITNASPDYVYFQASGASTGTWGQFKWGAFHNGPYYWSTPNQTINGTTFTDFQYGPPMMTGATYYVVACDGTGCGSSATFTVPAAQLPPQTAFGLPLLTLLHQGIDVGDLLNDIVAPYTQPLYSANGGLSISASLIWGSLFFFIFVGLWLRPKDILIPCILAFIAGGFIMTSAYGIPVQFMQVGQGLMYASVAGIVISWFIR
jgi:hypothetical protein